MLMTLVLWTSGLCLLLGALHRALQMGKCCCLCASDPGNWFGRYKKSKWFSALTGGPGGPVSPTAPGGPLGPGSPINPLSPFMPLMWLPGGPGGPGSPVFRKSLLVLHVRELGRFFWRFFGRECKPCSWPLPWTVSPLAGWCDYGQDRMR